MCKRGTNKSIFKTILLSYILILLIPLLMGIIGYSQAVRVAKEDAEQYNMAALGQAMNIIDTQLDSIEKLMTDISLNSRIQNFIYKNAPLDDKKRYEMLNVIDEIARYKNTNPFIDELYIYFKGSDIVLKDSGIYEPHFFYEQAGLDCPDMNYNKWIEHLSQYNYRSYISLGYDNRKSSSGRMILAFRSLPLNAQLGSEVKASIGMIIDEQKLKKLLVNVDVLDNGTTLILDNNNSIIAKMGDASIQYKDIDKVSAKMVFERGYFYQNILGIDSMIAYTVSEHSGWKYITIIPKQAFMDRAQYIRNLTVVIFVLSLAAGFSMAYFMTCKEYNPLKRILNKLSDKMGILPKQIGNEYEFIGKALDEAIYANERIERELAKQKPVLRSTFLSKLIRGGIMKDDIGMKETIEFLNINLPYNFYSVTLAYIDDYYPYNMQRLSEDQRIKYNIAILDLINDFVANNGLDVIVNMVEGEDDEYIFLFNIAEDNINDSIVRLIQDIQIIMERDYGVIMTFCVGGIYQDFAGIKESFIEAKEMAGYRGLNRKVITYDDLCKNKHKGYYYPTDEELRLMNYMKAGDIDKVERAVNDIFSRNSEHGKISIEIMKCLFFDMVATAMKVANEMHIDCEEIVCKNFTQGTICHARDEILSIYSNICSLINQYRESPNQKLCKDILAYINANYTNPDICLTDIAQNFNMTVAYISHLFKKQMGIGIVDYINRFRIEKAKELLIDPRLKLNDIAEILGYANDAAFIRVFKKYEGVTPGRYREVLSIKRIIEL